MQRIIVDIWCQGTAEEVGEFYASVFPNTTSTVSSRYPSEGLLDFQVPLAEKALTVDVSIDGVIVRLINASDEFSPTPALSLIYTGSDRAKLERIWAQLTDGGTERMGLGEYPFAQLYGWVEDRYGVNWQIMLANDSRTVMPQLMFTGVPARAKEAINFYTGLFPDAAILQVNDSSSEENAVNFALISLADEHVSLMDSTYDHGFTFSPGVSLEVLCHDQAEIDRLWGGLSAVPEAEACGWLVDKFGVSWQIVPDNMDDLMTRPGAFEKLLGMKKIIIDEL